jgi:multidrug efflux pump subunit AcrB
MNFRNISAWSIRNPVVPIIIFIGLMLLGMVSFNRMAKQDMPDIEFPAVMVQISQPGAAPTEIETQVTQKIEAALRSVDGVDTMQSNASEGSSMTTVMFKIGTDITEAVNEVKNAVDQTRSELPDGILEPRIVKWEGGGAEIAAWSVSADDMTLEQLSWFVDDAVTKRLLSVDGMGTVDRSGGVNREIRVTLDPAKMQSLGVTAAQINNALRQMNINAAGGKAEIAGSRQSVRVLGNAKNAFELSQTDVPLAGGKTVKLGDFAEVKDSYGEITSMAKLRGKQVVAIQITRARGESDIEVYDDTLAEIAKIEKERPGIHFHLLYDSVRYTKLQYESSIATMVEGAILAVIVVFFFLRDWRATVIAAIAIPLSAIPSFYFLFNWFGFSLNSMSLLALGLVAGVLVDDAIVEIENIVRHMRMGKSAYQASIDAADEIGLAVVATTFSIVAVFLPVGIMGGIPGQFFKSFGITVVVSVLLSLAVARTITPMVAAYFLKAQGHQEHGGGLWMDRYMGILRWSLDDREAKMLRAAIPAAQARWWHYPIWIAFCLLVIASFFGGLLGPFFALGKIKALSAVVPGWAAVLLGVLLAVPLTVVAYLLLRFISNLFGRGFATWYDFMCRRLEARLRDHRIWMLGLGFTALLSTAGMLVAMPNQFFPDSNIDFSMIRIEMVPGTNIAQTEAVADKVASIVYADPDVSTAFESVREGQARIFVTLNQDRLKTNQEFSRDMTPRFQQIPDARITFQAMGPGGGGPGSGRPISIMLSGSDPDVLANTAATLVEQMKGLKEVVAPRVSGDMRRPEVIVKPRLDLAASLGVTTAALSQAIRIATLGDIDQNAAKFSLADRQVPIRVRLSEGARRNFATIQNLPVPTASGGSVPLSSVAEITLGSGPVSVQRYNQSRRIFVGADLAPDVVKGDAMAEIHKLPLMMNLPNGVSNAPVGEDRWQAEMGASFAGALIAGVLLVFSVLVLLYHRFVSPLVNMGSLFLAPLGGLLALSFFGQPISMTVYIGILMLFGIVAKNSILLVDFAIDEMSKGADRFSAIVEAGHKRAQPIVMTTVAMTAGMVPTAISMSGDGAWRAPMGTVVIGGLILSTLLTLLIVPAGFSLADGFEKRIGPKLRGSLLTYKPEDSDAANYPAGSGPETQPAE